MRRSKKYLWLGVILMLAAAAVLGFGFWRPDKPLDPALIAQGKDASAAMNDMGL